MPRPLRLAWLLVGGACSLTPEADVGIISAADTAGTSALGSTSATDAGSSSTSADDTSVVSSSTGGEKLDAGAPGPGLGCVNGNDLVYALFTRSAADAPRIATFDPGTAHFEELVALDCTVAADGTYDFGHGFAIDEAGRAWFLQYREDGYTFVVADVLAGNDVCDFVPLAGELEAAQPLSPTFARGDDDIERLFVTTLGDRDDVLGFGAVVPLVGRSDIAGEAITATVIGESPRDFVLVSGTGDGRIYGLAADRTADANETYEVVQLDPEDGSLLDTFAAPPIPLAQVAFYGGDLVLFSLLEHEVWHYDLDDFDGSGVHEYEQIADASAVPESLMQWWVVGAASSTCAPITPPG